MTIRDAGLGDADALAALTTGGGEQGPSHAAADLRSVLLHTRHRVLVLAGRDGLHGVVQIYFPIALENPSEARAIVVEIHADEHATDAEIAMLIDAAVGACREQGCRMITIDLWDHDARIAVAIRKAGFMTSLRDLRLTL